MNLNSLNITPEYLSKHGYKVIPGYDDRYFINPEGKIISFSLYNGTEPAFLTPIEAKSGYMGVNLSVPDYFRYDKPRFRYLSALVLEVHGPPKPSPKHKVQFIDSNPKNYHLSNLRWVTQAQINKRTTSLIPHTEKYPTSRPVIVVFRSVSSASKYLNRSLLYQIRKNNKPNLTNFEWPYEVYYKDSYDASILNPTSNTS